MASNSGNGSNSKKTPPTAEAATSTSPSSSMQASYRSITRMGASVSSSQSGSSSSVSSAAVASAMSPAASQVYRGFVPGSVAVARPIETSLFQQQALGGKAQLQQVQQMKGVKTAGGIPPMVIVQNNNGLKPAATVSTQSSAVTETTANATCVPREFPVPDFPLSRTCVTLKDAAQLDPCLRAINKTLNGELKPHKGCVRARRMANNTDVKVCAYREAKSGKVVIEFNRLDGCAFTFQRAFIQAKLEALTYLENAEKQSLEAELAQIEKKLAFWYGSASTDALAALSSSGIVAPLTLGRVTAV